MARFDPKHLDPDKVPEVAEWLRLVESGEFVACQEQHQVCKLVRRVFADEPLWLDRTRLDRYKKYQRYFPFDLSPEELFMLALMLCLYGADGAPRFYKLFLYVGRGYGKNGFITFVTFCLLSDANGIQNYNVDVCATTEEQAKTSFNELFAMLDANSSLFSRGFHWTKTGIEGLKTHSLFRPWSGNSTSKDGMRPGALIFDEIHAYQNNETKAVFEGGFGKVEDGRQFEITTDGDVRDGPLDEEKELARSILAGEHDDGGMLPMMFCLDELDEIHDEAMWPKANPRVARSANLLRFYRIDYQKWLDHPARHPEVPTKRFNLPMGRSDREVTSWDNLVRASREFDSVDGLPCILGIDYARTTDMLGACLLFRKNDEWRVVHHAWWCTHSADAGEVKAPLEDWARMGWLTIVDDVDISPRLVTKWAQDWTAAHGCTIQMAALDSYRITLVKECLAEIGLDSSLKGERQQVYEVRPSDQMRLVPVIEAAFANGTIAWGDSPLMRWSANNAMLVPAPNENWKYGKIAMHSRKTDAFMAFVAAMAVGDRLPTTEPLTFAAPVFF